MKYVILYETRYNGSDSQGYPDWLSQGLDFFHGEEGESKDELLARFMKNFYPTQYFIDCKKEEYTEYKIEAVIQCGDDSDFDFNQDANPIFIALKEKADLIFGRLTRMKMNQEIARKKKVQEAADRAQYERLKSRFG